MTRTTDEPTTGHARWTVRDAKRAEKLAAKAGKQELKAAKEQTRQAKQATKAVRDEHKAAEKAEKRRAKLAKKGELGRFTEGNAKKLVGFAGIVGPAAAPYVRQALAAARDGLERARARRLGVDPGDLGRFTGKGAALHARIAGDARAMRELRERGSAWAAEAKARPESAASKPAGGAHGETTTELPAVDAAAAERFAQHAEARLEQLAGAVRAAERMPTQRRRAAHRAVSGELDRIEQDLLHRFGL